MTFESLGLRHFHCATDPQGIAWVTLDCADSAVNRLSGEALAELNRVLDDFQSAPPAAMVIRSGKAAGFIAGADIDEFSQLNDAATASRFVERGWTAFNRLAAVSWPTLALIQGVGQGGLFALAVMLIELRSGDAHVAGRASTSTSHCRPTSGWSMGGWSEEFGAPNFMHHPRAVCWAVVRGI